MKSVLKKAAALIISLALIMSMLTVISVSADYAPSETRDDFKMWGENEVYIQNANDRVNFMFIPEYSGSYIISTNEEVIDPVVKIYNYNLELIVDDCDISDENLNASYLVTFEAGAVYYIETYINGDESDVTYTIYSAPENPIDSFDIVSTDGNYSVYPNQYIYLQPANFVPENFQNHGFSWGSSDENVAIVDQSGNVRGVSAGTAVITCTAAFGVTSTVTITVVSYPVLNEGETTAVVINEEGQKNSYEFIPSVSGNYIITVNAERNVSLKVWSDIAGLNERYSISPNNNYIILYYLSEGIPYYIETEFEDYGTGSYTFDYARYADEIVIGCNELEINENTITGTVGNTAKLYVDFLPEGSKNEKVTWRSDNESVATVTEDGVVAFNQSGTATIYAQTNTNRSAFINVNVVMPVLNINFGEPLNVEFTDNCSKRRIKFEPTVSGLFKLVPNEVIGDYVYVNIYDQNDNQLTYGSGSSDLEVGYYFESGNTYYFEVESYVGQRIVPLVLTDAEYIEDFFISCNSPTVYVGLPTQVRVMDVRYPDRNLFEQFTFSVDDETVATLETVSNSEVKIKGLKDGTVTLTATSQTGIEKTLVLTVETALSLEESGDTQVELLEPSYSETYKFVLTKTAKYEFCFKNIVTSSTLDVQLYSEDGFVCYGSRVTADDNFVMQETLQEGKTYFLQINSQNAAQLSFGIVETVTLEGISINGGAESVSGQEGTYLTLKLDTLPSHADYGYPEWSTIDESVVRINDRAHNYITLELLNEGQCELTATVGDYTDTITVNVTSMPKLELDTPVSVTITGGNEGTKYKFVPEEDGEYVFYSTGDSDPYAYLDQYGTITEDDDSGDGYNYKIVHYLFAGQTYYIRSFKQAEDESITLGVVVSKAVNVQTITLSETEVDLNEGEIATVTFTLGPINCKNEEIIWNSRNTEVAVIETVYANSVGIRAVSSGTAVISAVTANGAISTVTVNVKGSNEFVIGSANTVEITEMWIGEKFILNIEEAGVYEFYSQNINMGSCYMGIRQGDEEYQYFYSDSSFNFRFQKTLEAGTYQIDTGYNDGCIGSFDVYAQKTVTPETVIINNGAESIDVYVGDSQKLNLTLTPEFSNEMLIGWSSSDESVVTVQNGIINVLSQGTATVTATLPNGNSDSIIINGIASNSLTVGAPQTVELGAMGEQKRYRISIEQSGWYLFSINSTTDIGISLYDSYMNSMGDFSYGMRLSSYFEAGTYYVDIFNCTEQSGTADCFITKAPNITSLEIKNYPDNMQHEIGTEFDYTGLVVNATFENGQTADWTWGTGALLGGCYSVGVWEEPDENGNYGCTVIYAGGQRLTFTLEIVESNVVGFEVYSGSIGPFYENVDTRECQDHYHYNYHRYISNIKFIIRYRDGSYKIASCYENVDGYTITDGGDHCDELWTVGGDNYIYFCYRNLVTKFKVDLLENPVESIVVNTAPETEIIFGDSEYGWMGGDGYYLKWEDLSWLTFTVNYKDNTSKIFTINDAVFEYGPYLWDGQQGYAESGVITGAGTYTGYFKYMGAIAEFKFTVKASPVTSVEILKGPDVTAVKYGYYPDFKGMQLKVTYADNTEKIITVNSDNLVYELNFNVGLYYYIKDGDNTIEIVQWQDENGSVFYQLRYYDVIVEYKGFEFLENESAEITVNNINITGDKLVVTVDGITYSFDDVEFITDSNDDINNVIGYKETADGLMMYTLSTYLDDNGYVTGFEGNALGMYFGFEILSGDFNGDGAIDVRDLVAAKNASANMAEPENKFNADMNFDGKFDASDLPLYIRRLLNMCA